MRPDEALLLVLNAGSSSVKFALFDEELIEVAGGAVTEIGGNSRLVFNGKSASCPAADHGAAMDAVLTCLEQGGFERHRLRACAHRIVHGGRKLTAPIRISPAVEAEIEACNDLAPLHNPHNLAGIRAVRALLPELAQYGSFDTAFHAGNPELATRYAIAAEHDRAGIRRYGFHGISYAGLVAQLPEITGAPLPKRLIAFHLGNGASACAIRDGKSVATTMGYSPLEGLTMGTRSGSIDGNAVLDLAERHGIAATRNILNKQSGLLALGGASDMRTLAHAGTNEARFAIDHFVYWAVRYAGSLIAACGGVDAVAFTGGIGEHDRNVRGEIMRGLAWTGLIIDDSANATGGPRLHLGGSAVEAWIVPAQEEKRIALDAMHLMHSEAEHPFQDGRHE